MYKISGGRERVGLVATTGNEETGSKTYSLAAATVAAAVAALGSAPADSAETAQERDAVVLQEITVTAQRRVESAQVVPMAMTAVDGVRLEALGVRDSQDLQRLSAGLIFGNNSNFAQPYIRGVGTEITVPGAESSVATFIDDVYQPAPYVGIAVLSDIERVEVLKGPQGTLYGRNATGGAINIQTKEPGKHFESDVQLTVGNFDALGAKLYVSGPLSQKLSANLSVSASDRDGFAKDLTTGGDYNSERYRLYRGKLSYDVTDELNLLLSAYHYSRNDTAQMGTTYATEFGSIPVPLALGGNVTVMSRDIYHFPGYPLRNVVDYSGGHLRARYSTERWTLSSITAYSTLNSLIGVDFVSSDIPIFDFSADRNRSDAFIQTIDAVGDFGSTRWAAGISYFDNRAKFDPLYVYEGPNVATATFAQVDTDAIAVYGEVTRDLTDTWSITGGVRYTDEEKTQARLDVYSGAGTLISSTPSNSRSWGQATFKLLLQRTTDNLMTYAKFEQGFKSGTVNTLTPFDFVDPEEINSYEIGFKSELAQKRVRVNASAYYYDYKNLQRQYNDIDTGASRVEAARKAEVYGLDLLVEALPIESLTLSANVNLMHSEYRHFVSSGSLIPNTELVGPGVPGNSPVLRDLSGNELTRAPDWSFNLSADWRIPLGSLGETAIQVGYFRTASYFINPTNRIRQDAYDLLSSSITYVAPGGRWRASLWGRNLTNSKHIAGSAESALGDGVRLSDPRTYGLTLGYSF